MRARERNPCARGNFDPALDRTVKRPHQQQLHPTARFLLREQPRRQHASVVDNDQVAGAQMPHQFIKSRMLDSLGFAIQDEQPSLIAPSQRLLRNQLFRQIVLKFRKSHLDARAARGRWDSTNQSIISVWSRAYAEHSCGDIGAASGH